MARNFVKTNLCRTEQRQILSTWFVALSCLLCLERIILLSVLYVPRYHLARTEQGMKSCYYRYKDHDNNETY